MSHMASRTRDNLGRAIVMTMISLTDDGPDRVPLSVVKSIGWKAVRGLFSGVSMYAVDTLLAYSGVESSFSRVSGGGLSPSRTDG